MEPLAQAFSLLILAAGITPPDDAAFAKWHEADGVVIERAVPPAPAATPWIRGTGEVEAPAADVAKLVSKWDDYVKVFDPMIKSATVLEKVEGGVRFHLVWDYPWPFRDRDAIVRYTLAEEAGGAWVLTFEGDEKKGDPKSVGVRIQEVHGTTRITPVDAKTSKVVYRFYGDLGGDFGKAGNEKAWKGEVPIYFQALRRGVKKD